MFVPVWMIFLFTGLVMAILAVAWGIRSKQFDDQDRARYLPLVGLSRQELEAAPTGSHRAELAAIWVVIAVGFGAIISGLIMTVRHL